MTEGGGPGTDRTKEILEPSFVEGLEDLPLDEVRRRRDRALAEREFHSYLRRLVQVREDILRAERARRSAGGQPEPLVERLTQVMSGGPRGSSRGEALRLSLSEDDLAEAQGRADALFGEAATKPPEELADEELDHVLATIDAEEHQVSAERTAIIRVLDRLQEELRRRYREDPSEILRR
jgi:anti-sigma-K factor RsiG